MISAVILLHHVQQDPSVTTWYVALCSPVAPAPLRHSVDYQKRLLTVFRLQQFHWQATIMGPVCIVLYCHLFEAR